MSSYVDATATSVDHCEAMGSQFPELAEPYYSKLAQYCQDKLWHQLTLTALDFLGSPKVTCKPTGTTNTHMALYENVILKVATKLNSLSLARMAALAAFHTQATSSDPASSGAPKQLLEDLLKKKQEERPPPMPSVLFLQSKIALLELQHPTPDADRTEKLQSIYAQLKTNAPLLNQLMPDSVEATQVNEAHYEMSMSYYKLVGPPEAFYDEAIHYLNYYTPPTAASDNDEERRKAHTLAVDLCLAALTGEGVYNLGQVVGNPILQVLASTPDAWLVDLLQSCAAGQVAHFKRLCQETYQQQIASQPALVNMSTQMQEKMTLLALVQMVFERPSNERTLTFGEIAQRLELPLDQVEWVLMRAFSVKLMEGSMDQVSQEVHVTWVLPRVLSSEQMQALADRFGEWATKVESTKEYMVEQTPTLTA